VNEAEFEIDLYKVQKVSDEVQEENNQYWVVGQRKMSNRTVYAREEVFE
jgi:hypothetical protein